MLLTGRTRARSVRPTRRESTPSNAEHEREDRAVGDRVDEHERREVLAVVEPRHREQRPHEHHAPLPRRVAEHEPERDDQEAAPGEVRDRHGAERAARLGDVDVAQQPAAHEQLLHERRHGDVTDRAQTCANHSPPGPSWPTSKPGSLGRSESKSRNGAIQSAAPTQARPPRRRASTHPSARRAARDSRRAAGNRRTDRAARSRAARRRSPRTARATRPDSSTSSRNETYGAQYGAQPLALACFCGPGTPPPPARRAQVRPIRDARRPSERGLPVEIRGARTSSSRKTPTAARATRPRARQN